MTRCAGPEAPPTAPPGPLPERVIERRDVTRNRAKLLAAADEILAAHGEDATIESIAHKAGLGVGTAYRHFANKQALLQALFATRIDRIRELLDEVSRVDDATALERFLRDASAKLAGDRCLREAISLSEGFEALSDSLRSPRPANRRPSARHRRDPRVRPGLSVPSDKKCTKRLGPTGRAL